MYYVVIYGGLLFGLFAKHMLAPAFVSVSTRDMTTRLTRLQERPLIVSTSGPVHENVSLICSNLLVLNGGRLAHVAPLCTALLVLLCIDEPLGSQRSPSVLSEQRSVKRCTF